MEAKSDNLVCRKLTVEVRVSWCVFLAKKKKLHKKKARDGTGNRALRGSVESPVSCQNFPRYWEAL